MNAPVRLTIVGNEVEAELVCGLLRAEGLRCTSRITDIAFGQGGELALSGGGPREVLVRPEDHRRATELLATLTPSEPEA